MADSSGVVIRPGSNGLLAHFSRGVSIRFRCCSSESDADEEEYEPSRSLGRGCGASGRGNTTKLDLDAQGWLITLVDV